MMKLRNDSIRSDSLVSVLSYYESNIALSKDSDSLSFLANIASTHQKQRRRLSMQDMLPTSHSQDSRDGPVAPPRHHPKTQRRASCSATETVREKDASFWPRRVQSATLSGTVKKTKEYFECISSHSPSSIASSAVLDGFRISPEHFRRLLQFWSSLPKPSPDCVVPPYPNQWNSLPPVPTTVRDIALRAATPGCMCGEEVKSPELDYCSSAGHSSICSSCGLDSEWDDSSVVSSAVCVYDGSNLYLPLSQGCMVFRTSSGSVQASKDKLPQRPSRRSSQHIRKENSSGRLSSSQSVASLSTFASFSTGAAPRRVRFSEEDEVWFFEVDDLSSVFSTDGLELAQDFSQIFDGGRDSGPRQVRRQGSETGGSEWEYVGFYDSVKLPQDFGSTFRDGKEDTIPRLRVRRSATEGANSLLDKAPQMAPRRGSFELEDCPFEESEDDLGFDHFAATLPSALVRREKGIHPRLNSNPTMGSSFYATPDKSANTVTENGVKATEGNQDSPSTTKGSADVSPRRVARRLSIEKTNMPSMVDLDVSETNSEELCGEVDARTESTTESYTEALQMDDLSERELPIGKSMLHQHGSIAQCECVPMSEYTMQSAMHESIKPLKSNWSKGANGAWKKPKANRRASTGSFLRPTKLRGHSFDKDSDEAEKMAQACLELKSEGVSPSTGIRPRKFSWDQDSLRPGLVRGYSFLDLMDDAAFDSEGFLLPEMAQRMSYRL